MTLEPGDAPRGRQSVLVGTFEGEPWIAYPARENGQMIWAVEMSNKRVPTDVRVDEEELLAGRPSLTPRTVAKLNQWLTANAAQHGIGKKPE